MTFVEVAEFVYMMVMIFVQSRKAKSQIDEAK